jgi:hypothetical protein
MREKTRPRPPSIEKPPPYPSLSVKCDTESGKNAPAKHLNDMRPAIADAE